MRPLFPLSTGFVLIVAFNHPIVAQDIQIRQRAVSLLERADSVVAVKEFSSYEQTIRFRSLSAAGAVEGLFTSVTRGPRSYRDEYEFGNFHLLVVVNGSMIADVGDRARAPLEVREITRLNRPYDVRFDDTDVIHSIEEGLVDGHAANCVEFDTVAGQKTEANEICIDKQLGTVTRSRIGATRLTFSDFFKFHTAQVPGHITYEQGDLRMELNQTKTPTEGPFDPDFLTPPMNAKIQRVCQSYRRPYGRSMPQPKSGSGNQRLDVMLHGTIREDGKIREATIDRSELASLNAEALTIFNSWTFTPALCDSKPIEFPVDVTLHFQGR